MHRCWLGWDLQEHPDDQDDVAEHKDCVGVVELALLIVALQRLEPGLSRSEAEHGDEGPVEGTEVLRRDLAEEGHPDDGIWRG